MASGDDRMPVCGDGNKIGIECENMAIYSVYDL